MKNSNVAAFFALVLGLVVIIACGTFLWEKIDGSWWNAFDVMVTVIAVNLLTSTVTAIWKAVKQAVEKL